MNISEKIQEEYKVLKAEEAAINEKVKLIEEEKKKLTERLQNISHSLYQKTIFMCHINEIFRVAKIQFSRLSKRSVETLTAEDILELNKWIGRVKSEKGYKDIIDALNELSKYSPNQIKSNLYALTQKIIIGGAYKRRSNVRRTS
jgi:hypothetical protein